MQYHFEPTRGCRESAAISPSGGQRKLILDAEVAALPTGHLQLNGRAKRDTASSLTIGNFLVARDHLRLSPKAAREVEKAVEDLKRSADPKGLVDWDRFRRLRAREAGARSIFFMSPRFSRLNQRERQRTVATFHLRPRTVHALQRIGIRKIDQLLTGARLGLTDVTAVRCQTSRDIIDALDALSLSIGSSGEVDWDGYAQRRGLELLPKVARPAWQPRVFVRDFLLAATRAVQLQHGKVGLVVLNSRFLSDALTRPSLAEIGRRVGRTRERVRAIEEEILMMFRRILTDENYEGCRFRLRAGFLAPLHDLAARFVAGGSVLSASEWQAQVARKWRLAPSEIAAVEPLILAILAFRHIVPKRPTQAPIIVKEWNTHSMSRAAREIERLLVHVHPEGLDPEQLLTALRATLQDDAPGIASLSALVRTVRSLEPRRTHGQYRARTWALSNVNRCYRILRDTGIPLRLHQLVRIANEGTPRELLMRPRSASTALVNDPRFTPVGGTGFWALTQWKHVEARPIVDVAADVLSTAGVELHEAALYSAIAAIRPLSQASINNLLKADARFEKTKPKTWRLRDDPPVFRRVG